MRFITLKKEEKKKNYNKCSVLASFTILHLFFTLNSCNFVDGAMKGRKNISCPWTQGTLAMPLHCYHVDIQCISGEKNFVDISKCGNNTKHIFLDFIVFQA